MSPLPSIALKILATTVTFVAFTVAIRIWLLPVNLGGYSTTQVVTVGAALGALVTSFEAYHENYPPDSGILLLALTAFCGVSAFALIFYLSLLVIVNIIGS